MERIVTAKEAKAKDAAAIASGIPSLALMQTAAQGIADAVRAYRDDWANRDSYFAAARDFFEKYLSMAVIEKQLAEIVGELVR